MSALRRVGRVVAILLGLAALPALAADPAPAIADVPGDSLYQLPVRLQTADGARLSLGELRGMPLVVTMFYSQCSSVCPLVTARLARLLGELSPTERSRVRVLMVSFDSERDTPEALTAFRAEHHIQDENWLVARAEAGDVRLLAAALGIRYRQLPDGTFNHSTVISVADRLGRVRARSSELSRPDPAFLRAVRAEIESRGDGGRRRAGAVSTQSP